MVNLDTLQKFCCNWRTNFKHPFTYGEKTYGTDGHILLRVNNLLEGVKEYLDFPYVRIKDSFEGPFFEPLPLVQFRTKGETEVCPSCKGSGKASDCPECEGHGEIELDSGWNIYSCECQTCGGRGTVSGTEDDCENCDGKGVLEIKKKIQIGSSLFDSRLVNKLLDNLPEDVEILPSVSPKQAALLRWEGGDGLLMPLSR